MTLPVVLVPHPHVRVDQNVLGGSPYVVGSRVPVRRLWAFYRNGISLERILKRYPQLSPADPPDTPRSHQWTKNNPIWKMQAIPSFACLFPNPPKPGKRSVSIGRTSTSRLFMRRGGSVVVTARLESVLWVIPYEGSNPSFSAILNK